jgi:hypothetical protein
VQIQARISRSGTTTLQSGDIEADAVISMTKNIDTVHLHLSRVIP